MTARNERGQFVKTDRLGNTYGQQHKPQPVFTPEDDEDDRPSYAAAVAAVIGAMVLVGSTVYAACALASYLLSNGN